MGLVRCKLLMDDPDVSDVLVNGANSVFIERNGLLERTDVQFANDDHLLHFIQRLVGQAGRRIDEVSPMVDAKLSDGSRLHAVIPPPCLTWSNSFHSSFQNADRED